MRTLVRRVLAVLGVTAAVALWPSPAFAHPLGNFTVNLYGGILLSPAQVRIDYVVDMAEIPTFQEMASIDLDGDGTASDTERAAWAERTAPELLRHLSVSVGGRPVAMRVVSASMAFRPGQGGLPILRLEATFAGQIPDGGIFRYADGNYPGRIGWREITAVGADGTVLGSSSVSARSVSDELRSYPQDLLQSPLHVTRATVAFGPGRSAALPSGRQRGSEGVSRPEITGGAFANLVSKQGAALVALALLLAVGFGALHALGPGHGKTLMAAYLVGAGGRIRHAVAVGAAVAAMHSASVFALGLVVLSAERLFPPERVYPWLGIGSGLVATILGIGLLVARLRAWRAAGPTHDHGLPHDHGPGAGHDHAHPVPAGPVLSRKGLAALAVAGGILPSPTALVVLLASVAFHRVSFGLALIGAFSLGLATALVGVGTLALRARDLFLRRAGASWGRLVPVLSACGIAAMGIVLSVQGVSRL